MSRSRLALPVLIAALSVFALPGVATAKSSSGGLQTFYLFKAVFTGSGTYTRTLTTDGDDSSKIDASFGWTTTYKNVFIPRVHAKPSVGYPGYGAQSKASGAWQITQTGGDACTGNGGFGRVHGVADGGLTLKRVSGGLRMFASAFSTLAPVGGVGDGVSACAPKDFWHDVVLSGGGVGNDLPDGIEPVTGIGKITPSDLRKASFTKNVLLPVDEAPNSDCGSGGGNVCTQSYSWTGKVTFTKTKIKSKK